MEWKKVETSQSNMWNFQEDKELEGVYIGCDEGVGQNESLVHHLKKDDGTVVDFWGKTVLDRQLENVENGTKVKIIYKGKAKSAKTGREFHDFDVFYAEKEE